MAKAGQDEDLEKHQNFTKIIHFYNPGLNSREVVVLAYSHTNLIICANESAYRSGVIYLTLV